LVSFRDIQHQSCRQTSDTQGHAHRVDTSTDNKGRSKLAAKKIIALSYRYIKPDDDCESIARFVGDSLASYSTNAICTYPRN